MHTNTSHTTSSCLVFSVSLPSLLPCIKVQTLICELSVTILLHSNQNENDASRFSFYSEAEPWILTPRKDVWHFNKLSSSQRMFSDVEQMYLLRLSVWSLTIFVQHLGKHPSTVCSTFFQHSAKRDIYMELKADYACNSLHASIISQFPSNGESLHRNVSGARIILLGCN